MREKPQVLPPPLAYLGDPTEYRPASPSIFAGPLRSRFDLCRPCVESFSLRHRFDEARRNGDDANLSGADFIRQDLASAGLWPGTEAGESVARTIDVA